MVFAVVADLPDVLGAVWRPCIVFEAVPIHLAHMSPSGARSFRLSLTYDLRDALATEATLALTSLRTYQRLCPSPCSQWLSRIRLPHSLCRRPFVRNPTTRFPTYFRTGKKAARGSGLVSGPVSFVHRLVAEWSKLRGVQPRRFFPWSSRSASSRKKL